MKNTGNKLEFGESSLQYGEDSFVEIIHPVGGEPEIYKYYWNHLSKKDIIKYHEIQNKCTKYDLSMNVDTSIEGEVVKRITIKTIALPTDRIYEVCSIVDDDHKKNLEGRKNTNPDSNSHISKKNIHVVSNPDFVEGKTLQQFGFDIHKSISDLEEYEKVTGFFNLIGLTLSTYQQLLTSQLGFHQSQLSLNPNNIIYKLEEGEMMLSVVDVGAIIKHTIDDEREFGGVSDLIKLLSGSIVIRH